MKTGIAIFLIVTGLVLVLAAAATISTLRKGISARRTPTRSEAFVARRLRRLAIPRGARSLRNPEPESPEVLKEAMAHFADHCASCHGNDGKGQTEIGKNLYPKAPDMTLSETQRLSDGELFYIIKNGVRFTGMPAWGSGTPEDDRDSWKLVRFIRRLPRITEAELAEMEVMNPISPSELKEREEEARFLAGKEPPPARRPQAGHEH